MKGEEVPESPAVQAPGLTKFQVRILAVLAEEARYGLAVKEELNEYYGEEVHHGRIYPNLTELVEKGYVDKSELDKRTNQYAITERGREVLVEELQWLAERAGLAVVDDDHRLANAEPATQPSSAGGDD